MIRIIKLFTLNKITHFASCGKEWRCLFHLSLYIDRRLSRHWIARTWNPFPMLHFKDLHSNLLVAFCLPNALPSSMYHPCPKTNLWLGVIKHCGTSFILWPLSVIRDLPGTYQFSSNIVVCTFSVLLLSTIHLLWNGILKHGNAINDYRYLNYFKQLMHICVMTFCLFVCFLHSFHPSFLDFFHLSFSLMFPDLKLEQGPIVLVI